MTPNANVAPPAQQPGWFSRNWKWLVPVGCLVPMMCCGVFGVGTYFTVAKVIQGSPAFVEALAKVNQSPEVAAALGAPVTPGFGLSGEVKQNNNEGTADFTVPLTGSKGSGSMHVQARSVSGRWVFQTIDVEVGGKHIDVLGGSNEPGLAPDDAPPPRDDAPPPGDEEPTEAPAEE